MTAAHTLAAGGIVPVAAKLGKDEVVDTVIARAYRHAVLGERVVVRLVAESIAAGDELEMGVLGFGKGEALGAVGKERRRPLGFPGWALVHDPKNARFALDVVKELDKWSRRAKSKPGAAKDGIDAIAAKLGKTVPQFLPSFYEEAGRAFVAAGSPGQAAVCFGKAREAEGVHALEVDEQHRVDAFLEFALAGAVTTKALAQYAKELGEHHAPEVAYGHFRQLCVQRTLGGMPPWAGMPKELRRLAKAAKRDPDVEDEQLVAEIIESPALGKAPAELWRAYAAPIAKLAVASADVRRTLAALFPTGAAYSEELDTAWLDLVEGSGALAELVGVAAWFDKLCNHLARNWRSRQIGVRAFALLQRLAPQLIAEGKPISCAAKWGQIDLDLVELALSLGVAVAPPEGNPRIDFSAWAKRGEVRDPVRAAAHPLLGPLLAREVGNAMGTDPFDTVAAGKAGLVAAKRAFLTGIVDKAERGGIVGFAEVVDLVAKKVKAAVFAELPDLHARLAAADVAPALARTLRIGIFEELGWPALEEAAAELGGDVTLHGGLPAMIVATKARAIAVGPTQRLGAHDLVLPKGSELHTIRFVDGQFLVVRKLGYKLEGYWSGAPHDAFASDASHWAMPVVAPRVAVLPDGAWLEGERAIRPGDRHLPVNPRLAAYDGATAWTLEHEDGIDRLRELSRTGELGRASWPAFLEEGADSGELFAQSSYVLASSCATSPLGHSNGLCGVRRRIKTEGRRLPLAQELVRIDGKRWSAGAIAGQPTHLIDLPGRDAPRPVDIELRNGLAATIFDTTGEIRGSTLETADPRYLSSDDIIAPPAVWHALVPRDPAGSAKLAAITDAEARALVDAAPAGDATPAIACALVGRVLPEVTHPRLARAVANLARRAAELAKHRDTLCTERAPDVAKSGHTLAGPDDGTLYEAIGSWFATHGHVYYYGGGGPVGNAVGQIAACAAVFAGERGDRRERAVPSSNLDWLHLAVTPGALAVLALAIGRSAAQRRAIRECLAMIVRRLPAPARLRVFSATGTVGIADYTTEASPFEVRWHGGRCYAICKYGYRNQFHVLEYAPDGVFAPPPGGLQVERETRGDAAFTELDAVLAASDTSWRDDAPARLAAATGLTPGEAALLWAGCPRGHERGHNFLDKELREQLGLKANQAAVARDALQAMPRGKLLAVLDATARAGIAGLLDGRGVDAMAAAWTRTFGARVAIPEDLIADADRELQTAVPPAKALAMIGADEAPELSVDGSWALDERGNVIRAASATPLVGQTKLEGPPAFGPEILYALVSYVPFLFAELPVGHGLRARAAAARTSALARLAHPGLLVDAGTHYPSEEEQKTIDALLDTLGGDALAGLADAETTGRAIRGAIVIRAKHRVSLVLRPAEIDAKSAPLVARLAAIVPQWGLSAWHAIAALRSPDFAAFAARIAETPVPAGSWEQNPLASAPAVVKKAAKHLGVSADAAALYLQFLVLLWPTPKRLVEWNNWKPKQLAAATAELVAQELVLEAKRERAQRAHFLPGGWEALKSPHPPLETWKVPMYATRTAEGALAPTFGRFLATAPFHILFERAWQRIAAGDVPRYEEVKR